MDYFLCFLSLFLGYCFFYAYKDVVLWLIMFEIIETIIQIILFPFYLVLLLIGIFVYSCTGILIGYIFDFDLSWKSMQKKDTGSLIPPIDIKDIKFWICFLVSTIYYFIVFQVIKLVDPFPPLIVVLLSVLFLLFVLWLRGKFF